MPSVELNPMNWRKCTFHGFCGTSYEREVIAGGLGHRRPDSHKIELRGRLELGRAQRGRQSRKIPWRWARSHKITIGPLGVRQGRSKGTYDRDTKTDANCHLEDIGATPRPSSNRRPWRELSRDILWLREVGNDMADGEGLSRWHGGGCNRDREAATTVGGMHSKCAIMSSCRVSMSKI
jgi:hypothetical protein